MPKAIGIDLGTTNSCVSLMEGVRPRVIANIEGSRTTPSIVTFTEDRRVLIGQLAKRQAHSNPENTITAIKRLTGRRFDSPEIEKAIQFYSYKIIQAKNKDAWVDVRGKQYSPSEISAMILLKMKQTAEIELDDEVTDAVITVPAYFDDNQRQSTKDAGKIAGLNVLRIINEPTAAALAYGLDKEQKNQFIAVFDLGGGTFDISILEIKEGVFQVMSTNGDTFLGGEDFDEILINYLADGFKEVHQVDLRNERMAVQRLKEAAENAKHELSYRQEVEINLPFIYGDAMGPKHLNTTLTRSKLEQLVSPLIERLESPCQIALEDADLNISQIDEVILVGGMTRMPVVQKRVEEIFGKPPRYDINPDEAVALGAAIQGAVLQGEIEDVLLLDVTPLSLGIETAGGILTRIIDRNTTIPTRRSRIFTTARDNQSMVEVHILQGEREMAEDNISLGKFQLVGIPPSPRGVPQVEVTFDINADGIVEVYAKDLGTGKEQNIRITDSIGLEREEISRLLEDAKKHADADRKRKELIETRNEAEGLLYTTSRLISEMKDQIESSSIAEMQSTQEELKRSLEGENTEEIRIITRKLITISHRISTSIYTSRDSTSDEGG